MQFTPIHEKLVKAGLLSPVGKVKLAEFIDDYIASRTDIKNQTRINLCASRRLIVKHFGASKDLRLINPADIAKLKATLLTTYANATVSRVLRRGRQFFGNAVDAGIITKNPFDKMKFPSQKNPSRLHFIDRKTAEKVNDACPSAQWRLIFALARFGGLRIPSELVGLKWTDILWEQGKIRIHAPKTEHIEGKDQRWLPLFPELRKPLEESFELAKVGDSFIFPKTINNRTNLRKGLTDILKKAGISPWPKLFQNLRSSRETELCQDWPLHIVTNWIGNTAAVAVGHYLQVTDNDFAKATGVTGTQNLINPPKIELPEVEIGNAESNANDAKTTHFTTHQGGSDMFSNVQNLIENPENYRVLSALIGELQNDQVPRVGIEPTTS
ncbi:hypothetical protein EBX93_13810 [bacterium]|nr:hypothetical protein [bacterium]